MLQGPKSTIKRARRLRREMSLPEVLPWQALRQRPEELKFRHQHPSGPYSADFYCHKARLVIEIDGEVHGMGNRPRRDAERDAWFAERRFDVMRIPAQEVLRDVNAVAEGIVARANFNLEATRRLAR
jgi:very-short-patch-repair endonuclease